MEFSAGILGAEVPVDDGSCRVAPGHVSIAANIGTAFTQPQELLFLI